MTSVVSVHDRKGKVAGAGILVAQNLILTCAHVANTALLRQSVEKMRPADDSEMQVRFASAPDVVFVARIDGGEDAWSPPPATERAGADLCLLRIDQPLPQGASIASLQPTEFRRRIEFIASGYPADWNGGSRWPELDVARGEILGEVQFCWLLRVDSDSPAGGLWGARRPPGAIHGGFSGGPVQVGEAVVALVVEARKLGDKTAYGIPAHRFPPRILSHPAPSGHYPPDTPAMLREFPLGPAVDRLHITSAVKRFFASQIGRKQTEGAIQAANEAVLASLKDVGETSIGLHSITITLAELPPIETSSMNDIWTEILNRAGELGPRMVAAFLLTLPQNAWTNRESERDALLQRLRSWR